ncbi:uncharacterized protein LOC114536766 [Dendronephthya gigantea]|uniref:uncharacterized protein LOC114536766 n=1 Tax=Dendronephthya gigantea TaxID=151771 RepID=UPI0010694CED|nr:uncharacterized protein LOC114536766 [Dendronephthya gigantea]
MHIQHCFLIYLLESLHHFAVHSACELTPQVKFPNGKQENSRLEGLVLSTKSGTALECFGKCVRNCHCKSINVCGTTCELNSGNQRDKTPSNDQGCTYYELSFESQNSGTTGGSCAQKQSCSCAGNPCMNGGTCVEQCPTASGKRHRCSCPKHLGIRGERCEDLPKSCRSIYDANPGSQSGVYTLYDDLNQAFRSFCDFTLVDGKVWTLVQSFSRGNRVYYKKKQLFINNPRSQANPAFNDFRLPKATFTSIQKNSTHFRITCNYDPHTFADTIDYVRLKTSTVDFLTYNSDHVTDKCILVEYLNIRGGSCTDCTVAIMQTSVYNIYTSVYVNSNYGCDWQYPNGHATCENLGGYDCYNNNYRCSSSSTSTSNTWYGS